MQDQNQAVLPFAAVFWEAQISISALAGERLMDRHVARLNIEHYRKLIATEPDETKRQTLIRLQAEEELKLTASLRRYAGEMNRIAHSYFQNQPNGVTAHVRRLASLDGCYGHQLMKTPKPVRS